jgi:hypothetical protein
MSAIRTCGPIFWERSKTLERTATVIGNNLFKAAEISVKFNSWYDRPVTPKVIRELSVSNLIALRLSVLLIFTILRKGVTPFHSPALKEILHSSNCVSVWRRRILSKNGIPHKNSFYNDFNRLEVVHWTRLLLIAIREGKLWKCSSSSVGNQSPKRSAKRLRWSTFWKNCLWYAQRHGRCIALRGLRLW